MQDGSKEEVINLWRLWHRRLPRLDLDQARLGFTSTTNLQVLGQHRLWSKHWEKDTLVVKMVWHPSVIMDSFSLWRNRLLWFPMVMLGPVCRSRCLLIYCDPCDPGAGCVTKKKQEKSCIKQHEDRARPKTVAQMFRILQTSRWRRDCYICLSKVQHIQKVSNARAELIGGKNETFAAISNMWLHNWKDFLGV